jgi:hypothetical protein
MQHPAPATVSTSPPAKMRASLLGAWQQAQPAQRLGYLVGGALILVGLGHLAGWLVVGGAWAGPVSLRKPTTFGISFGLTTITFRLPAGGGVAGGPRGRRHHRPLSPRTLPQGLT